ncbi:asparagine synthase (glutamine-hydrolyzing) [Streptomyces sp. V4I23]|uniref:asparagine synthase (glutamine-hydrolyzing) n=1 Tax=Streptomyces sp. V4I23 TaxID=3042282 RepID=UPI0027801C18|nr:asparagine synthase (glutamine-hydrolyzing) [Streptomyces sp. V4I23]MDQ1006956.1 asparagine synthase (glutamine-hydrolyzing) [Streptomyces sp. V4I23]
MLGFGQRRGHRRTEAVQRFLLSGRILMCGFVVLLNGSAESSSSYADPCKAIAHRGPDASGHMGLRGPHWQAELYFRRLAVVDLDPRSDQPFGSPERGVLVYNGEIYNASQLRETLRRRHVTFTTEGDTEVLYELLLQPDASRLLDQVDGMFAFVLVLPDGELRYGRDRLGVKPLYTAADSAGRLAALASEIEPLRATGLTGDADPVAVAQGAMFLWTPPPRTGWQRVRAVPTGIVLAHRPPSYDEPSPWWRAAPVAPAEDIRAAVRKSVARQVRADVTVGLLLSGGLDSTWLGVELAGKGFTGPAFAARPGTSAAASAEPFEDDAPYAAKVADRLGLPLTWVDLDVDVLRRIPELVTTMELPFGDPAAFALLQLSHAARREATVLLSGLGVEELFLGYERYQAVQLLQRLPAWARPALGATVAVPRPRRYRGRADKFGRLLQLGPRDWSWATQAYYSGREWAALSPVVGLEAVTERHRAVAGAVLDGGGTPLAALAECDRRLFLPGLNLLYGDRASMRASVELRVPFLGEPVVACALGAVAEEQLRLGNGKARFRAAAVAAGVPEFVARRPKTGFGAPVRSLLREHGARLWPEVRRSPVFDDVFDRRVADRLVAEHVQGGRDRGLAVFGLFCAAVWWELNAVGGPGRASDVLTCYTAPALG